MIKDFLKQVFAEEKQLLHKSEVSYIHVPNYEELTVKALWPDVSKHAEFLQYFPDAYPKNKGPPRDYFFNVLNTVEEGYLQKVLAHANELRMGADGEVAKRQGIKISQFWEEQLKSMPYISSKCLLLIQTLPARAELPGFRHCRPSC